MKLQNEDVVINVDGMKFTYRRSDLSQMSGYFRRLFDNDNFVESSSNELNIYGPIGNELTSRAMQIILGLIDSPRCDRLDDAGINELLMIIDYLQIEQLTPPCVQSMKNSLTFDNWSTLYTLAKSVNSAALESACMEYFRIVFGDVDYSDMSLSEFKNIIQVLQVTMQTNCIFEAIISWVKCNGDYDRLQDLLNLVDFKAMDAAYINKVVMREELIAERAELVEMIQAISTDRKFLMVGGYEGSRCVAKYSPMSNELTNCSIPPFACDRSAVTLCQNKLVLAGGNGESMAKVQIFDTETECWSVSDTTLKTPRYGAKAVTIHNKVYVVGGSDGKCSLSSIEVLELVDGVFVQSDARNVPSLKHSRTDHTVSVRNGEIVVVGGYSAYSDKAPQRRLSSCEVINTATNERYDIAPLTEARSSHSTVIVNDKMIVTSGFGEGSRFNRLLSVESYSFSTSTWSSLPPLQFARAGHCSRALDGKVYVMGGTFPNNIECLDTNPPTGVWSKLLSYAGIGVPSWEVHHQLSIPSYRLAVVQI